MWRMPVCIVCSATRSFCPRRRPYALEDSCLVVFGCQLVCVAAALRERSGERVGASLDGASPTGVQRGHCVRRPSRLGLLCLLGAPPSVVAASEQHVTQLLRPRVGGELRARDTASCRWSPAEGENSVGQMASGGANTTELGRVPFSTILYAKLEADAYSALLHSQRATAGYLERDDLSEQSDRATTRRNEDRRPHRHVLRTRRRSLGPRDTSNSTATGQHAIIFTTRVYELRLVDESCSISLFS